MGVFLEATEMKEKALVASIKAMELEDLDDLYVIPAERLIAESCNLNLNTEGHPWRWHGRFTSGSNAARLLADYLNDYRLATIQVVNSMVSQPHGITTMTVKGSTNQLTGRIIPPTVRSLMAKWSAPRRLYRV